HCPINVYRQRWTSSRSSPHIHARWRRLQAHPIHRVGKDLRYDEVALKFLPRSVRSTPVCSPRFFPSCEKLGNVLRENCSPPCCASRSCGICIVARWLFSAAFCASSLCSCPLFLTPIFL